MNDESLGTQIATSVGFGRVPSGSLGGGSLGGGEKMSWDEMGQLGLHKALHEYYKLSDSKRKLRLCQRGGPPSIVCSMLRRVLTPQLPAALSPPALFAAAGWVLYAAAWLLYSTAPLTIPLALWLAFAADGSLALAPAAAQAAVAAAAHLHPVAGVLVRRLAALVLPLLGQLAACRGASLALLPALAMALQLSERVVRARRQAQWDRRQAQLTAADVQAQYASWALPGARAAGGSPSPAARSVAAAQQELQRRRQLEQQRQLAALRAELERVCHDVYGTSEALPAEQLQTPQGLAEVVAALAKDTGVELPPVGNGQAGSSVLLDAVQRIKLGVGLE